jgi:hypothetical protein
MSQQPAVPHEGGRYVIGKDGTRRRAEFTRQAGEPDPETTPAVPPSPATKSAKKEAAK